MDSEFRNQLVLAIAKGSTDRYLDGLIKIKNMGLGDAIAIDHIINTASAIVTLAVAIEEKLKEAEEE